MESSNEPMHVDIEGVLKKKASNRRIPRFLVNYLRKIIHEDEINEFLKDNSHLKNMEFMAASFKFLNITLNVEGKENLPQGGRYIFASNHPLGGLDGVATGYVLGLEYENKVKFFSNDILTNLEPVKDIFVPVNKFGAQSRDAVRMMDELYSSEFHLITYPAGLCSRRTKGKICDLEWKKNFISKSVQHHRDVVPIYFEGRNSDFFYNLANFRKLIRLKFNLEMMYLADEMFKQKGKTFTIRIGKPIPWQTFDRSKNQQEWAQYVKDIVYDMA